MNPDPTPQLPPVLPGLSEPIRGPLKCPAYGYEENDVYRYYPEEGWVCGFTGADDAWYSIRIGSSIALQNDIALANGIGVVPEGLPPLPPVPEGYDRWEYRGRNFATRDGVPCAVYYDDDEPFEIFLTGLEGLGIPGECYFFEAACEPTSDPCESVVKESLTTEAKPEAAEYHGGFLSPEKAQKLRDELAAANAEISKWIEHGNQQVDNLNQANSAVGRLESELAAARAEIQRLSQDKEDAKDSYGSSSFEAATLKVDNDRLRAALEAIRDREDAPSVDLCGDERLGVHCGVEDRGCSDRYEGADYGYGQGIERGLEWASNLASSALEGTPPAPDGWREMDDNAPKDGTPVMLWWPYWSDTAVVGFFSQREWQTEKALTACKDSDGPRKWMPLPKPPTGNGGVE